MLTWSLWAEIIVSKSCAKNSHNVCPLMSTNVRPSPLMSAYVLSFLDSMRQGTCFLGHMYPLMSQKTRPFSHRIQKWQDISGHWRTCHPLYFRVSNELSEALKDCNLNEEDLKVEEVGKESEDNKEQSLLNSEWDRNSKHCCFWIWIVV